MTNGQKGKILIVIGIIMTTRSISIQEAIDGGIMIDNEIIERLMEQGVSQEEAEHLVNTQEVFTWLRALT